MPFIDHILYNLTGTGWYYLLDGYLVYNQISISLEDQEKTSSICPYGTLTFKKMPFDPCNISATFQQRSLWIFFYYG